jgi:hypothetical protein
LEVRVSFHVVVTSDEIGGEKREALDCSGGEMEKTRWAVTGCKYYDNDIHR